MISYYILILLFFAMAAICNSVMDTLDHHYSSSIFAKFKNGLWWNAFEGWRNKYVGRDPKKGRRKLIWNINYPVQWTDAWHFFKMLMIIFAAISVVLAVTSPYTLYLINFGNDWNYLLNSLLHISILGLTWNLTFSLFYNKLLIRDHH